MKYSAVLYLSLYVVLVVAGVVMWAAASTMGLRDNVEGFIGSLLAADDFQFLGPDLLRASVTGGAVLVALGTGANLVMVTLYNLISNLVGGVEVTFAELGADEPGGHEVAALDVAPVD